MKILSKDQMKKILGGVEDGGGGGPVCDVKAKCGSNGDISCTGYRANGCTGQDYIGVGCIDQTGTFKWYGCGIS